MRGRVSTTVALIWMVALGACASEPKDTGPADEQKAAVALNPQASPVTYSNPGTRFEFDLPSASLRVDRRRYDAASPPNKVKERFEIRSDETLLVRIDVWTNSDELSLDAWAQAYASYLNRGGSRVEERKVGRRRVRALVFDTPRSCQAPNIVTALFALDGHVVAVTCRDGEDAAAKDAFDKALGSFAMEAGR